jgi:two-component system, LytTR family, sensor kinase
MKRIKQSFLLRLFVVIIFHLIFKQGDTTYTSAFEPSLRSLLFSIYFIIYWMLFWEACSYIYSGLLKYSPDKKIWYRRLSFVSLILLSLTVLCAMLFNWGYFIADNKLFGNVWKDVHLINPEIFDTTDIFDSIQINPELLFGFILIFILTFGTHVFITSMKNVKELEVLSAQQNKENITAQYNALKNQIDPHFFFNSLSVLSSLIYESTELSASYISHLSKHYRYTLETNTDTLVTAGKELDYLESYFFLIKIRHEDYINFTVCLSDRTRSTCRVLPYSLQMLVENAVKHNVYKKNDPLQIEILEDENYLIIRNNLNKRKTMNESTGIGLENICRRYAIESRKQVLIEESGDHFTVKLPKLQ